MADPGGGNREGERWWWFAPSRRWRGKKGSWRVGPGSHILATEKRSVRTAGMMTGMRYGDCATTARMAVMRRKRHRFSECFRYRTSFVLQMLRKILNCRKTLTCSSFVFSVMQDGIIPEMSATPAAFPVTEQRVLSRRKYMNSCAKEADLAKINLQKEEFFSSNKFSRRLSR